MEDLHALHPQSRQPGNEAFRLQIAQIILKGMGQGDKGAVFQRCV